MSRWEGRLRWGGAGLIVWALLVRMMSMTSRVPWWDIDPSRSVLPESTITPSMSLGLDAMVWIASGAVLLAQTISNKRIALWSLGAIVFGSVGVALHGFVLTPLVGVGGNGPGGDFASLVRGSLWASALIGAWALAQASKDRALWRIAGLVLLGSAAMLIAKGAHQYAFEHPQLVAHFDADPASVLRSQGIEPDSTAARLYERRLRHPDATGWFGLSNVYGSVLAVMLVVWTGLAIGATRLVRDKRLGSGDAGLMWLVVIGCGAGLAASASKGALGAAAIGLALVLGVALSQRVRAVMTRRGAWIAVALPLLVLVGVIGRGMIGERLGELSLLFRWHYMQGSAQIIAEYPLTGVGPMGFKDAYMMARPPVSPEEVESPHSLALDWLATLGVFGMAWLCVWAAWLWRAGASISPPYGITDNEESETNQTRGPMRWGLLVVGLSLGASWWVSWGVMPPTEIASLLVGGIVWMAALAVSRRAVSLDRAMLRVALGAGAITLAVHSMIEVTSIMPGSAACAMGLLALAATGTMAASDLDVAGHTWRRSRVGFWSSGGLALAGVLLWTVGGARARDWEEALHQGANVVEPVATIMQRIETLETVSPRAEPEAQAALSNAIGAAATALRLPTPSSAEALREFLAEAERLTKLEAIDALVRAAEIEPSAPQPITKAARLHYELASLAQARGDRGAATGHVQEAEQLLRSLVSRRPRSASSWGQLAGLLEAITPMMEPGHDQSVAVIEAWTRVAELDPQGLRPPHRLAVLLDAVGDREGARRWARRALEVDEAHRLDPLKQLRDDQREELERLAGEGSGEK